MAWYKTGTVSVTQGSDAVQGAGTDFVSNTAKGNGFVGPDGVVYEIDQIIDLQTLHLAKQYGGVTAQGAAYSIMPTQAYIQQLTQSASALLNTFGSFRDDYLAGDLVGKGLQLKGVLSSSAQLPSSPAVGDAYLLNASIYGWNGISWNDQSIKGDQGVPGDVTPTYLAMGSQVANDAQQTSADRAATSQNAQTASAAAITATSQATLATTKASIASDAANAASVAASSLVSALSSFRSVFIGDLPSAPTVDGNGNPLQPGVEYFDTTKNKLQIYTNSAWGDYDQTAQAATNNAALSASNAASSAALAQSQAAAATASQASATASAVSATSSAATATTDAGIATVQAQIATAEAVAAASAASTATTVVAKITGVNGAQAIPYQSPLPASVPTNVYAKLQNISVDVVADFLADPTGASSSLASLQAASDALKVIGGVIRIPPGTYIVEKPVLLWPGVSIDGPGAAAAAIVKTTNSPGIGSIKSPNGYSGGVLSLESYAVDSIISIVAPDNSYAYNTKISNITLKRSSYSGSTSYGIYAPRLSHAEFGSLLIQNVGVGIFSYNSWMCHFRRITCQAVNRGFYWQNDGSGSGAGTSTTFEACWVNFDNTVAQPIVGFDIFGLTYSAMIGCGCDNGIQSGSSTTPVVAYSFNSCAGIHLVACATENLNGTPIASYSSTITVTSFRTGSITGAVGANTAATIIADSNSKMTLIGCSFYPTTTASSTYYNWLIQNGASVIEINPGLSPTGGNTFTSYSGGASKTTILNGVTTVSTSIGSCTSGKAIDNTPIGSTTPSSVAATTVSATTSCAISPGSGAWGASYKGLQVGNGAFVVSGVVPLVAANYYNNGFGDIYSTSAAASRYYQSNGTHYFAFASVGTVGNPVIWSVPYQLGPNLSILNVPVQVGQLLGGGGTPAITTGVGLGTNGTCSVAGTSTAMTLTANVGTAPTAGWFATVTFSIPYAAAPRVMISPANAAAAALTGGQAIYTYLVTTNAFILSVASAALAAGTTYVWNITVIQ